MKPAWRKGYEVLTLVVTDPSADVVGDDRAAHVSGSAARTGRGGCICWTTRDMGGRAFRGGWSCSRRYRGVSADGLQR